MYQVFRSLSLLFMGLTSTIFVFSCILEIAIMTTSGAAREPLYMKFFISSPVLFSITGFFLSLFTFYSFGILEKIKIKVKALDDIYNGKAQYKEYLINQKKGEK
ncbi:hypothetical protein ACRN89_00190 [Streptococcus mitis]|uniref:hypothetical protein n=1 Tax=Streptococcus mitis TaxID=28037 RepID=UPI003D7E74C0